MIRVTKWFIFILLLITIVPLYALDSNNSTIHKIYAVPDNIEPCIVCKSKEFIVIEDTNNGMLVSIRCTNPKHYPYFLVMASGINVKDAVLTWNNQCKQ